MTTQYQEDWLNSAVGRKTDMDGDGSFDCVDVAKDYAEHIWASTTWKDVWPQAGNACDMFWPANTSYVDLIQNDVNNPSQIPQRGDIIVYGGTKTAAGPGINEYGHIAVVTGADVNGVDVIQEDTYLQEPMTAGRLGYWNAGTGTAVGWLRPKFDTPLAANQRKVGASQVNERADAKLSAAVVRVIQPNTVETWKGYVRGDTVTVGSQSSNLWFKDDQGCASILFFDPTNVDGLSDLTPAQPLAPNERIAGASGVNQHANPDPSSPVVRSIPAGSRETWLGYVHGTEVTAADGTKSDLWFKDAQGYASVLFFDPENTDGLPDLTSPQPKPSPLPPAPPLGAHMDAVDVSGNNKGLDLTTIPCQLAFIKATEGVGFTDPTLQQKTADARKSGKIAVFYHMSHADEQSGNTADAELQWFLGSIKLLVQPGDSVALDWELGNVKDSTWAKAWLDGAAAALKCVPVTYLDVANINGADWSQVEPTYPLWFAHYPASPATSFSPAPYDVPTSWKSGIVAWQYSDKGHLPPYQGAVDLDVVYTDAPTFKAKYGIPEQSPLPQPTPAPTPAPAPTPTPTPAPSPAPTPTPEQNTILAFLERVVQWLIATFTKGK